MVFKHLIKIVGNQNTTQYVLCQSQLTHSIHRIAITNHSHGDFIELQETSSKKIKKKKKETSSLYPSISRELH